MAAHVVEVEGLSQLIRAFGKIDKGLQKELRKRLKRAALPVIADYHAAAPKKTGKMAASARPSLRRGSIYVRVTATKTSPKYSRYPYPRRIEYQPGSSHPLQSSFERQRPFVQHELGTLVDWVADEFGRGATF